MSIVFYVSGHGLGHATREITVLQSHKDFGTDAIPLVIKSASPEWHWRNELPNRHFSYVPSTFDVGTIQRDSLDSDASATLMAWRDIEAQNEQRFASEREDLIQRRTKLIVSDIPSFPIKVAARLGIPSVCIATFTWADIYEDLAPAEPGLGEAAEQLRSEYAQTMLHLEAGLALPMPYFPSSESIGIIARTGNLQRDTLYKLLPESAQNKRLALVYAGNWGLPIPYAKLSVFTDWHFLSLGELNAPIPANWTVLSRAVMAHPDLVASVDVVISKIGYGLVGECLTGGTPIIYCPRTGFAEYPIIDAYLSARQNGMRISVEQFTSGDWGDVLANVPERGTVPKEVANGGERAANRIATLYHSL